MSMDLRDALLEDGELFEPKGPAPIPISTGLTILDSALTGVVGNGVETGSVVCVTGSANSGRTTFGMTIFSEACHNSALDDYWFIYYGDSWDSYLQKDYIDTSFRYRLIRRQTDSVQAFWDYVENFEYPFIIMLDSLDILMAQAWDSEDAWVVTEERAKEVFDSVRKKNSLLIINCREKRPDRRWIGAGPGTPSFYSDYSFLLQSRGALIQQIKGRPRFVGTRSYITVAKSKTGLGIGQKIYAPIYCGSGYDDVESIIAYLLRFHFIKETVTGYRFHYQSFFSLDDVIEYIRRDPMKWRVYANEKMRKHFGLGGYIR